MHLKLQSTYIYENSYQNILVKWFWNLLIFVTIITGILYICYMSNSLDDFPKSKKELREDNNIFFDNKTEKVHNSSVYFEKLTFNTKRCHIPSMLPIDEMIKKYVRYPNEMKPCPNTNYSLLARNASHVWLNNDARILRHYNISIQNRTIRCCYSSFYRPDDISNINSHNIDERIKYNDCIYFNDVIEVKDEFVQVTCNHKDRVFYNQFFVFAPFKNLNEGKKENDKRTVKVKYNVLVIGLDSVSRLNFHRTMPKTAAFMKSQGAVELLGYNKVGYNSYPNIVPLLMGYAAEEIKKICHPVEWTTYDDCPFLWHWYKEAGFYTAFGEDSARLGTFNYIMKGFRKTPTDYYLHPFIAEAERVGARIRDGNVFLCIYENHKYQMLLDYVKAIAVTLWEKNLFGFFWETTVSHDNLNYPMVMDDSYLKFFSELKMSNYLDETIVFLISDHGIRWGDFRQTKQGYLEERLPLAYILTPSSFLKEFSEAFHNLQYNSRQLTTPFDLHETLLDLIDLENVKNETIVERTRNLNSNMRGISLFLKVPENRTCEAAGIADHWCACNRRVPVANTSKEIMNASKYLIKHLNSLLSEYPQCAVLELDDIQKSNRFEGNLDEDLHANWTEYSILVKVKPSGGVFEATLRDFGGTWSVIGTVSRLNLYGNQSLCVNDVRVKIYCFCKGTRIR